MEFILYRREGGTLVEGLETLKYLLAPNGQWMEGGNMEHQVGAEGLGEVGEVAKKGREDPVH